ncbi:uncharacterized protein SCHCODRAFT_02645664 [Schizophyllum commune H4-8]|nr:uncharacterized protein SCHCODRAFT_02645664 [Schizophyllum commune H4-8]KAI5884878.1 hypothetical protein SCHCODRAFT_02645664 [Schizophyllum commune H4-8]
MPLEVDGSHLIAIISQSIVYGISLPLFATTIWALKGSQHASRIWYPAAFALFALSTAHVVVDSRNTYIGLIGNAGEAKVYFSDITREKAKNTINLLETALADAILIYRCWVLYRNWWIIAFPCVCWVGTVISGSFSLWATIRLASVSVEDVVAQQYSIAWITAFYSTTLATTFISTGLLARKLWIVHSYNFSNSSSSTDGRTSVWPILLVVVECGALYAIANIAMITVFTVATVPATYILVDFIGQLIPLTFYLIIVCAALQRIEKGVRGGRARTTTTGFAVSGMRFGGTTSYPPHSVEIHIDRLATEGTGSSATRISERSQRDDWGESDKP